jgi:hypothetical protein
VVRNDTGSVVAGPAVVTKFVLTGGGELVLVNVWDPSGFHAPVYDNDGATPLAGNYYLGQFWVGTTADTLAPVSTPVVFGTNGFLATGVNAIHVLPTVAPDQTVFVQLRAWESAAGATFDAAVNNDGRVGASGVVAMRCGGAGTAPSVPTGLQSFSLNPWPVPLSVTLPGRDLLLEVSSNLVQWTPTSTVSNVPSRLQLVDSNALLERMRFYRLRDPGSGRLASQAAAGMVRLTLPPGLSMVGLPLRLTTSTVERIFGQLPESSFVYQYDAQSRRYIVNIRDDGWSSPHSVVAPGEGCMIYNPTDRNVELLIRGELPQGELQQVLPQGWSMQANQAPRAGSVETVLGLPLEDGDIVVRLTSEGEMLVDVFMGGWWGGQAPEIQVGEGFWIWKNRQTVWHQSVEWPE